MSRGRSLSVAVLSALALATASEHAHAAPSEEAPRATEGAPIYTLEVASDAPNVLSYEALAARIAADLGGSVVRAGDAATTPRAAITIAYRERVLVVRAEDQGGRVLERTVRADGDDDAVQREAVLLAANLARDEARELLDARAARPQPSPAPAAPAPAATPSAPTPVASPPERQAYHPFSAALFSPLATNFADPDVRTNINLGVLYGRVGTVSGAQIGGLVTYASRAAAGAQIAGAVGVAGGDVSGAQVSGAVNVAGGDVTGVQIAGAVSTASAMTGGQIAGAVNLATGDVRGAQVAGAVNVATGDLQGVQVAGAVNVATGDVSGAQIGVVNIGGKVQGAQIGLVNIAEEVDGVALGLVSVTKDNVHPIVWASNLQYMNAGVKFATKYVYTIVGLHYGTREDDFDNFGTTAAIGAQVPLPAGFDVEVQGSVTSLHPWLTRPSHDGNLWVAPQAIAGYSFARHLRVFAGGGARIPALVNVGRSVVRPEVLAGVQF